ncbi:zinc-ribbon and DUF3426 domain-containing protein [Rhodoferax sp. BLA1]|uniref:zinc-ribbon and DUF3426 domain-containing protein n=1 Tax=Rhodoferax sp. BLA1 TaxID=2576062 RepID=UPI0015D1E09C|nr:zinc-ribbon and DUF3426 domain-containing protein [Rhodoferax sp. BLA1]
MSLLTRCPACTTLYKVVPDQLRISQGWVKCGQCGEIFDATQHLMEASTEPELRVNDAASAPVDLSLEAPAQGVLEQGGEQDQELPHDLSEPEPEPESEPESGTGLAMDQASMLGNLDASASQDDGALMTAQVEVSSDSVVMLEEASSSPDAAGLVPEAQTPPDDSMVQATADPVLPPSFMRDAAQPSVRARAGARAVWAGLGGLLLLVLAGQWVYQDHDRLAAARPPWQPALESVCKLLHCSVEPLAQIESMAIDSAAFSQGASDHYRLSFILKNTSDLRLSMPSVELTLTDAQEQAVVRRVLSPAELDATADHLTAHAEWPVRVNLRLQIETSAPAVVGYRLLAFYP